MREVSKSEARPCLFVNWQNHPWRDPPAESCRGSNTIVFQLAFQRGLVWFEPRFARCFVVTKKREEQTRLNPRSDEKIRGGTYSSRVIQFYMAKPLSLKGKGLRTQGFVISKANSREWEVYGNVPSLTLWCIAVFISICSADGWDLTDITWDSRNFGWKWYISSRIGCWQSPQEWVWGTTG